jgi:hypothetical protein
MPGLEKCVALQVGSRFLDLFIETDIPETFDNTVLPDNLPDLR